MKKSLTLLASLFFLSAIIKAQSLTQSFDVDGIKVIFKPTLKNIVNIRLYFRGGVTNYDVTNAGIENLALNATLFCGTQKYNTSKLKDTSDKYGILTDVKATYDYGFIQLNCISKYFNESWDLFSEIVTHPMFNSNELIILKGKMLATIKNGENNPILQLEKLQMQSSFAGTPYAIDPDGNQNTFDSFSAQDLKKYYGNLLNKKRIFIVAVGNITKEELSDKILATFSNIPSKPYQAPDLKNQLIEDNKLLSSNKDLKIDYISATMNAPDFKDIYYVPFRLGISALSGNLYQKLRTDEHLSYSTGANIVPLKLPYAYMVAGANEMQNVVWSMINTLKQIQYSGLNEEWLQHLKNIYITSSYFNGQSAAAITNDLGIADILGDWRYADDFPQLVNMVTVDQVNTAFKNYIVGLKWQYVGNTDALNKLEIPSFK